MPKIQSNEVLLEPYFSIHIAGKELPDSMMKYVIETSVEEDVEKQTIARISVSDPELLWLKDSRIKKGTKIAIRMGHRKNYREMLAGKIQNLEADFPEEGYPTLIVVAVDAGVSMTEGKTSKTWKNKKVSDVIKEIFAKHGISAVVQDTGKIVPVITQVKETDMDFAKRKAKESGVSITKDGKKYTWGKATTKAAVDVLDYRQGEGQIMHFTPEIVVVETDITDPKSKTEKDKDKSSGDVNMKDGSKEDSKKDSSSSGGGSSADNNAVLVDKKTGKVTVK